MKNHNEMYQSLLSRYEEHQEKKKKRILILKRTVPVLACFCLTVALGVGYWDHFRNLPNIPVQPNIIEEPTSEIPEITTTASTDANTTISSGTPSEPASTTAPTSNSETERITSSAGVQTQTVTTVATDATETPTTEQVVRQTETQAPVTTAPVTYTQPITDPPVVTTNEVELPQTPLDSYSYFFSSYYELSEALLKRDSYIKEDPNDYGELYKKTISAFENHAIELFVPAIDGNVFALRDREGFSNISFLTSELYNLPWIWYHCKVDENDIDIKISYYGVIGNNELATTNNYYEILKQIAPDAPNPDNYTKFNSYQNIYESEMSLANGRTVVAMISEIKNTSKIYVMFNYDNILVSVYANKNMLSESFWSRFTLEEY